VTRNSPVQPPCAGNAEWLAGLALAALGVTLLAEMFLV
jgi:hypothetical protein